MNHNEAVVKAKLEERGFTVLRNGWPDFLCTKQIKDAHGKSTTGVMAVEVKAKGDSVSESQNAIHKVLRAVHIPVYVLKPFKEFPALRARHFLSEREKDSLRKGIHEIASEIANLQRQLAHMLEVAEGAEQFAEEQTPLLELCEYANVPTELVTHHNASHGGGQLHPTRVGWDQIYAAHQQSELAQEEARTE